MGPTKQATCRSYRSGAFDGCEGCVDAALDAVVQSGLYVLARLGPGLTGQVEGPVDLSYRLRVRMFDADGAEIGADDLDVEQSIALAVGEEASSEERPTDKPIDRPMRLDDFQAVMDQVRLEPAGKAGLSGSLAGTLFGFSRLVGRFDIQVGRA